MSLTNQPDNTILVSLLNAWAKDMSKDNYARVRKELMDGNSFLMLPSGKKGPISAGWNTTIETARIQLSSLYTIDAIKVLGAYRFGLGPAMVKGQTNPL